MKRLDFMDQNTSKLNWPPPRNQNINNEKIGFAMINKDVIDGVLLLWSFFDIRLLTLIAAGFTIYFGYQKVTKKISVSFSIKSDRLYESHITNFAISNKRDNVVIISSIKMSIGKKGNLQLIKFDKPLVLKGYESIPIDIPKYSKLRGLNGPIAIEAYDRLTFSVITGSGDVINCDFESPLTLDGLDGRIIKQIVRFNDIILTNRMEYIFNYRINGKDTDAVFDKGCMITGDTPFGINFFPEMSGENFENYLVQSKFHDYFENYALFKVNENLVTELIFTKNTVEEKLAQQLE